MRSTVVAFMVGLAIARPVGAQTLSPAVYMSDLDVPCGYVGVGTLTGPVSARSLEEYVHRRDEMVLQGAAARGGDAAFIPRGDAEPGRDGVGFPVSVVDGVPQVTEREVTAIAIKMTLDGCLISFALARAQAFEGTLTYSVSMDGVEIEPSVTHIKGTRLRQETVTDSTVGVLVVDEIARRGRSIEERLPNGMPVGLPPVSGAPLVSTDLAVADTIAGIECHTFRIQMDVEDFTVCAASGLGVTGGGVVPLRVGAVSLAQAFPGGFLPLRVVEDMRDGMREVVATSFEPGPVDEALFEPLDR